VDSSTKANLCATLAKSGLRILEAIYVHFDRLVHWIFILQSQQYHPGPYKPNDRNFHVNVDLWPTGSAANAVVRNSASFI
jgi:hypothetical protein